MDVKVIEGIRIGPHDTLVIISQRRWTTELVTRMFEGLRNAGVKAVLLPPDAQVYIKSDHNTPPGRD